MLIGGIVLSGGKSSRMGTNKSLLRLDGKEVILRIIEELQKCTDDVYIITNDPPTYKFIGRQMFSDRFKNKGPLAGLETALYNIKADAYMLVACDMPFIDHQVYNYLLQQLEGYDAVIPVYEGRVHPLAGIYKQTVLPSVQQQLEKNELRMDGFFEYINVKYVKDFGSISDRVLRRHFFNMNHPEQYEEAKTL
ncbi:MAG TPA: molybdenum cofactor guanylyltransferase [Virgibacillus sp.]|nr:molybdenum cofactor guanylyltransferase [Virgibacillus sp.]